MSDLAGIQHRVIVLGGGFGGAYCARLLSKSLPKNWSLTLIDRNNFLLFYPLLVEAGVGSLEPRHVVLPIRRFISGDHFVMAEVASVDLADKQVRYRIPGIGREAQLPYDELVLALGSVTRLPDVPGLKEFGFEMKSLHDSVLMRDRAIRLLEIANTIDEAEERRAFLRVFAVGSNFTGIEFAGEHQGFMREAVHLYPRISPDDIEVHLIEYANHILPAIDRELGEYARKRLEARGVRIRTGTTITKITEEKATLSTGEVFDTRTVVWCAGISPNPLLAGIEGLPLDAKGYIQCEANLRVRELDSVWAIGDSAAIPAPEGGVYAATAQNATRQGVLAAKNILATIHGQPPTDFRYKPIGSLAAIGRRRAVAMLGKFKLAGFLAWFIYRTVYVLKMPGFWRKVRIIMDWTIDLAIKSEPVQLGLRRPDANVFDPPGRADKPLRR